MGVELHHTNDITWHHVIIGMIGGGVGCVIQGGSVMESYQFEILDQYFSVIVTIPHISIESQSLCIPTYFSVYLKPQEVIIMHKIHKYLKTFLLADDGIHCHDITWSWLVPSLIFEFDIQGQRDGTRRPSSGLAPWQPPHHSPTAPQPTFNLISINYDNVWLHSLNVVEGWMLIGKNSLNNFISHLSWLKKLSPTHTHPLISIHEFSKPCKLLFFELESLIKCWMWIGKKFTQ